jgi:hypothetical protein
MTFVIAPEQPSSVERESGSSQPHRNIVLIDGNGYRAEVRVKAEMGELDSLYAEVLAALTDKFPAGHFL